MINALHSKHTFYVIAILLVIIAASVNLSGCQPFKQDGEGVETPTPTSQALFEDDFSKCGGWQEYRNAVSASSCIDGVLEMKVSIPQYSTWSIPDKRFGDCAIEVEATQKSGANHSAYGIIFRYLGSASFYEFDINGNGSYSMGKYVKDEWTPLVDWTQDSRIRKGLTSNQLRVEIRGRDIVLFINDSRIATYTDMESESGVGDVGLIVNTFEQGGTVVQFDNFRVMGVK
jgi:hypothetical protein